MTDTQEIDIEALLAERRQIAIIWSTDDIWSIRPDLDEAQAWEVLQEVLQTHEASCGVTWETLECVAQDLFGDAPDGEA